jgi:hypothetical protein
MLEERKKLLVFAEDRDVAEVAAFGLRMHEGWEPVLATTAAQAYKLAHDENVAAIAVIVIQPSAKVARIISKLMSLSSELHVPLVGITPEPSVHEQFALLGVKAACTPFDPIGMWEQLPATA